MSFVKSTFGKDPALITIDDINELIVLKREENQNLEYKSALILNQSKDLSTHVSSFLNSEGGLIVIGVSEDDPSKKSEKIYPKEITPIGNDSSKERVEQLILSNIKGSAIPIIKIYPIRFDENKSVYLVDIPQGESPPYQAADNKYYRRVNFMKHAMQHYEIADFFGRRTKPFLALEIEIYGGMKDDKYYYLNVNFTIGNIGKAMAKHVIFTATFTNSKIQASSNPPFTRIDRYRNNLHAIQFSLDHQIIHASYPNGNVSLGDITLKLPIDSQNLLIRYSLIAENMDYYENNILIDISQINLIIERPEARAYFKSPPMADAFAKYIDSVKK